MDKNVDSAVDSLTVREGTSSRTQNKYYVLVLTLVNGTETQVFLDGTLAGLLTMIAEQEDIKK